MHERNKKAQVVNTEDLDVRMSIYNLVEYFESYKKQQNFMIFMKKTYRIMNPLNLNQKQQEKLLLMVLFKMLTGLYYKILK